MTITINKRSVIMTASHQPPKDQSAMTNESVNQTSDKVLRPEFKLPGADHHIKIPDGEYHAVVVAVIGFSFNGQPKLKIWFRITDDIPGDERMIEFFANLLSFGEKGAGRNPAFKVGQRSKLTRIARTLWPGRFVGKDLPTQWPVSDQPVLIRTETVTKDRNGKLPADCHYSKVKTIIGWASDADSPSLPLPNLPLPNLPYLSFPQPNHTHFACPSFTQPTHTHFEIGEESEFLDEQNEYLDLGGDE